MVRTRGQLQQVWPNPTLSEIPEEYPQDQLAVGVVIDVLDHYGVWCPGRVDVISDTSVTIHYQGWPATDDEVIVLPHGSYRLASLFTYTRCAKCTMALYDDNNWMKQLMGLWPGVVHFRMPDPFKRIPVDPLNLKQPYVLLRSEKLLFFVPYFPLLLRQPTLTVWNKIQVDGGMWVDKHFVQPWSDQQDLRYMEPNLRANVVQAYTTGLLDTSVSLVLTANVLQEGALLKKEFLVTFTASLDKPAFDVSSQTTHGEEDDDKWSTGSSSDEEMSTSSGHFATSLNPTAAVENDQEILIDSASTYRERRAESSAVGGSDDEMSSSVGKLQYRDDGSLTELPPVDLNDWDAESCSQSVPDASADDWMGSDDLVQSDTATLYVIGQEVDFLDSDNLWTPSIIVETSIPYAILGAGGIDTHCIGFPKLCDANLDLPTNAPRVAPRGTYTRQMKCCFQLLSDRCNGKQLSLIWPCIALFRVVDNVPHRTNPLQHSKRVFVTPYSLDILQELWCLELVDGGMWVSRDNLKPWTDYWQNKSVSQEAFEVAEHDTTVPAMTADVFIGWNVVEEYAILDFSDCNAITLDRPHSGPTRRVSNGSDTLPGSPSSVFPPASPLTGMKLLADATVAMFLH